MTDNDQPGTGALHDMLAAARDTLCGCGLHHEPLETAPGSEWAAVPVQSGIVLHHLFARLLNYWHAEQPAPIGDYLEAVAFGLAHARSGESAAHVGSSMLRILWHWYESADPDNTSGYWPDLSEADRHRLVHALADAVDVFTDVMEGASPVPDGVDERTADALGHLRAAARALGCGASNVGLDHLSGSDRAYIEAASLGAIVHGRVAAVLSGLASDTSPEAVRIAQSTYPVAAAAPDMPSERVAASVVLGSSAPLAAWFRDRSETMPRAGAVWRLLMAANLLSEADTIADADREGYADHLVNLGGGDERGRVSEAVTLMRAALASMELETR